MKQFILGTICGMFLLALVAATTNNTTKDFRNQSSYLVTNVLTYDIEGTNGNSRITFDNTSGSLLDNSGIDRYFYNGGHTTIGGPNNAAGVDVTTNNNLSPIVDIGGGYVVLKETSTLVNGDAALNGVYSNIVTITIERGMIIGITH